MTSFDLRRLQEEAALREASELDPWKERRGVPVFVFRQADYPPNPGNPWGIWPVKTWNPLT